MDTAEQQQRVWKVAKHCADEDGTLKQLDDHYFHKELNKSIFLLEQGEELYRKIDR